MPTALVSGGARGIGYAAAAALLGAGFDVAIASLERENDVDAAVARLRSPERKVCYFSGDIADVGAHARLLNEVRVRLGAIHCLVNNAGVTSITRGDMLDLPIESFDRCVATNLRGTFFLTQAVARGMIADDASGDDSPYRSIVTITSVNAEVVGLNRADYCMTKAGLSMASKLFAARLAASRIHVFELRPGIIRTEMTAPAHDNYDALIADGGVPLERWGEPSDVGATVATIARGLLSYATGEVLNVGGGLHLHRI
ncbi:MAG TPA: 3-ketoacyl-ACP reductase [Casimicrobiaceae bacterium]|nr:3-ketoacyl-ACP reductase [Casimicrobiaceae bacterium]